MTTPRNQRLSILSGSEAKVVDSPLRRRINLNNSSMPPPSPIVNNIGSNTTLNDDEAERRTSRRFERSFNEQASAANLAEAADSLSNCLKLFAENKINKDNAWSLNIIDSFANLIQKHHHVLSNFQVAGTTLEASAKVYGLRVDSVYTDVVRMTADLARKNARALTKGGNRQLDDDNSDDGQNNEAEKENLNGSNQQNETQPKVKKAKKRKNVSTITKNPESLNGRLDTIPLTDPFFAKLNSVIGDTTSSKRLMQNIIPTEDSKLKLRQNLPIWKSQDQKEVNWTDDADSNLQKTFRQEIVINPSFENISRFNVRLGLATYRVCNEPIEQYDENEPVENRYDDYNISVVNNTLNVGLQFDINAAVEPVPFERSMMMDFGDMDQGDFEDLNEMDRVAVDRCKGLRRQAIVIEDMQPMETSNLEYSYRPLDMIDQFWAGPSHWKFRHSRRTNHSIGSRMSQLTCATVTTGTAAQRKKVVRKRKLVKKMEATLEEAADVEEDIGSLIMKSQVKVRRNQLSNHTITRKWDSKKHKLPEDFKIQPDTFDKYIHAFGLHINSNDDVTFIGNDDDATPYNYNNETDRDYCSRVNDIQSDTETETNTDMGQMDNNFDNLDMPPPPVPIDEIPDFFEGAPRRIEKINIAFARRAKVVDMKQLKGCSWSLLNNKHLSDLTHNPKFSEMLRELPKVLSRTMAENMSMPLAFYAVLHLCNDKSLLLNRGSDNNKDFEIQFLD